VEWEKAGLLAPSTARLHKLATLAKARIHKHRGALQTADRKLVAAVLQQIAAAW
jgi:mRNA interferase MazF